MPERLPVIRVILELGLVGALLVAIEGEVAAYSGDDRIALAVVGALVVLPLAVRRRMPLPAHSVILVAIGTMSILEPGFESVVALLAIVISMANLAGHEPWPTASVGAALAGIVLAMGIGRDPSESSLSSIPPTVILFVLLPMAVGLALRRRQQGVEHFAALAAEAETRERRRIARELHDVVSHGVSVMVIQAQAGQRLVDADPAGARESLAAIELTGRRAMGELRQLLGLLREDPDDEGLVPQPGVADLPALGERFGASGLEVRLRVEGEAAALPSSVDVSAYRIVQEALTNALRHGTGRHADVRLSYAGSAVTLEVANDGAGGAASGQNGFGLAGMRERVSLLGGTLDAGQQGDRFVVRASLPR